MNKENLLKSFTELYGDIRPECFFAPGRVNLIGEHTDHEGGYVFPCAIAFGIYALAAVRPRDTVRLYSLNFDSNKIIEVPINNIKYDKANDWANYPLGVINIFERHGYKLPSGLDILFCGNLPEGAGLSSSAAIEVLTGRIINDLFNFNLDGVKIALYAQEAENDFVGMHCGIMDQFASSMGKKDNAVLLDCASLKYEYAPLNLGEYKIVITNSNMPHSLNNSAYNLRREQCEAALSDLQKVIKIQKLCELNLSEFKAVKDAVKSPEALKRARHAISENARTLQAVQALKAGDLKTFGELMNASHISLRDDYEVTIPELDLLAELAWAQDGVAGSRMTGGGFGGCTVSIVKESCIDEFKNHVGEKYLKRTGRKADFYVTETADGARKISC
ncbi:MAG: galactokinase [Synergistaceae bacterium]|nr:galactokinase [Synergistaceae bacterium]